MKDLAAPFDPNSFYSPNAAASHLRTKCPEGRKAPVGPRFFRRLHAIGGLPAIRRGRRLLFVGSDLNAALDDLRITPEPPASRGAERAAAVLRREARLAR
jgi:hypothetical protein